MTNEQRNEVTIEVAGKHRVMRATFGAIRGIEAQLRTNLIPLIVRYTTQGDVGLNETAIIVFWGLRGADEKSPSVEEIGEAILEDGIDKYALAVKEFLGLTMKGVGLGKPEKEKAT